MTISIFGHRHPLMWVDQSESWFPAKHAHVRRHQTQHILCQQRLSYLRSTSNYFLVVAWFFYFFIEKADFFSKIQTFWRKRRPYLCVFFKKVLFADQSPLKRTQLVSLLKRIFVNIRIFAKHPNIREYLRENWRIFARKLENIGIFVKIRIFISWRILEY